MNLNAFHRILIAASIAFDVFFTIFCIRKYNRSGDWVQIALAVAASLLTIALVAYLLYFNRKVAALRITLAARAQLCPKCQYDLRGSLESDITTCPECGEPITQAFRREAAAV